MVETLTATRAELQRRFEKANEGRDYGIYNWRMDAAGEAKKRSILPHFGDVPDDAKIVDAGSGTGLIAEAVAREYRGATVYALDTSHELSERASEDQSLTELVYGDAAEQVFPDNSIDIMYYSTSGHEIESFGGPGRMAKAVGSTLRELKPGGRIIIRDFAKPTRTEPVYMRILSSVGIDDIEKATHDGEIDYDLLSPRALFTRFHREFAGGNAFEYEAVEIDGAEYIKISPEWAHEFYLRKDYTGNWRQEINEKYTYWTQEQARDVLNNAGYVDVQIVPDPNEYILENRLKGKVALFEKDEEGRFIPVPFPATHMVAVGIKPGLAENGVLIQEPINAVDYQAVKDSISVDGENGVVTIGDKQFKVSEDQKPLQGSKKTVYRLEGDLPRVLKVVRKDGINDHTIFKAMFQSITRESLLDEYRVPHMRILEVDPQGPPYRYFVQEAIPEGSVSAATLITEGSLTEIDVAQMASHINSFELSKKWQLDTNPFNWYRVTKPDGTTEMVYIDGKVYPYDEKWEFKKIGLLQWTDPRYVSGLTTRSATIPKVKEYEALVQGWPDAADEKIKWWKKNLSPLLQP